MPVLASNHKRKLPWLEILAYFLGSRALILVIAWLSNMVILKGAPGGPTAFGLNRFTWWDGAWYTGIAELGYSNVPGTASNVAFFPLYPLTIRLVGIVTPTYQIAGAVVANACLVGLTALLWSLIERDAAAPEAPEAPGATSIGPRASSPPSAGLRGSFFVPGDGMRAVRLLYFGPVSFFFSAVYSESLFLLLSIGSVWAARRRRFALAGIFGCAAALSRNAGVLLVVPLLCELLAIRWERPRIHVRVRLLDAIFCGGPLLGLAAWSVYLWVKFGDPLLFLKVQAPWGRKLSAPWVPFQDAQLTPFAPFYRVWFQAWAYGAIMLLLGGFLLRLRPSYLLLAAAMLALNFSGRHLESIPRFLSVVFPLYMVIAWLVRKASAARAHHPRVLGVAARAIHDHVLRRLLVHVTGSRDGLT